MASGGLLDRRTIWLNPTQAQLRQHIVAQWKKTAGLPKEPATYPEPVTHAGNDNFSLEASLAQDFAFLAATEEGVQSVSAACVEGLCGPGPRALTIRLASNEGVRETTKEALDDILGLLKRCAKNGTYSPVYA